MLKENAGVIVEKIVKSKNAGLIAGVNNFDNILWFNDEKMTDALWYAVSVSAILNAKTSVYPQLETILALLIASQKKSEYKADIFMELLPAPVAKEKKTASKKVAAKKTAKKVGTKKK